MSIQAVAVVINYPLRYDFNLVLERLPVECGLSGIMEWKTVICWSTMTLPKERYVDSGDHAL